MMYIATPTCTIKQINRMLKEFLWGFNKEVGQRKTPLVTWKCLMQPRENGGLGFKEGGTHAQALLSKWVTKGLDDPDTEWAQLFSELMGRFTWENRRLMNIAEYISQDRILLGIVKSFGAMKYATGVWKSWLQLRWHLILTPSGTTLPA